MSVERMNHCLPAVKREEEAAQHQNSGEKRVLMIILTFRSQNLGNAILLVQKRFLIDLVQ